MANISSLVKIKGFIFVSNWMGCFESIFESHIDVVKHFPYYIVISYSNVSMCTKTSTMISYLTTYKDDICGTAGNMETTHSTHIPIHFELWWGQLHSQNTSACNCAQFLLFTTGIASSCFFFLCVHWQQK